MSDSARAMVQHGIRDLRPADLPLPDVGVDDAVLRVEACGICGSDYEQYEGVLPVQYPVIPGHEPVGIIERIGDDASHRWGVQAGDRVAVEALLPCGHCPACVQGAYGHCRGGGGIYGYRPLSLAPGLWGGYATHLYLPAHALVHRMSSDVPAELAVLFNPLGAGFRWAVAMPRLSVGETIVVLGPGQRGLAAVIAAKQAGAGCIIVTGLSRDQRKLDLARTFGADHATDVGRGDLVRTVREITGGRMADVVVDVTSYAVEAVTQAVDVARRGGRIVLAGTKGPKPVPEFLSDRVVTKELTIMGAFGVDWRSYEQGIRTVESRWRELQAMHTHTLPLAEAERGLRLLSGQVEGEEAIHIALIP
ncbi:MAG: alcohol dehydrogenase catalytic domain-containing protein [Chloroflexi bacterium]|nr:alcohol dehydrogenase catalytic domain-containing protein [Chloroflexota bacterium]